MSCSKESVHTDAEENINNSSLFKSSNINVSKSINSYLNNRFGENLVANDQEDMLDDENNAITLTSFIDPDELGNEIFTVSNKDTGEIVDFIYIDWNEGTIELTDAVTDEQEIHSLGGPSVEIEEGSDFMDITIAESNNSQTTTYGNGPRGFGWTCGPVVDLLGGSFRTCCHRIFWQLTQGFDQYGTGDLPGSNPKLVSI